MDTIKNTVYYCCVARGNRILYTYSGGDHKVENLAVLCLERTPPFHTWYLETLCKRTYGFFIEDGYVYFTIVDEGLGNSGVLRFLEGIRDEFKKVARKGSKGSFSSMSSIGVQEQLVPVIRRLITTLENVSCVGSDWTGETPSSFHVGLSRLPSNVNRKIEPVSSTKSSLLGKSSKQDKKKAKDNVVTVRDIELEENQISTDTHNQGGVGPSVSLQRDLGSMRTRSGPQSIQKKYWRQIWIVLAIYAAVCIILFVIWLSFCHGISCLH